MVVHRQSDELPTHDQLPGEIEVIPARLEVAGRVVVEEEHAARPVQKRQPKELGAVDRRLGAGAEGELADRQETVAPIQADESEDLPSLPLQPADQELARDLRLIESFCGLHLGLGKSLAELDRRQQRSHLGRPEAGACRQLAKIETSNSGKAPSVGEQAVGLDDRVAAPPSSADQHG